MESMAALEVPAARSLEVGGVPILWVEKHLKSIASSPDFAPVVSYCCPTGL